METNLICILFFLSLVFGLFTLWIIGDIVLDNQTLYCMVFERDLYKGWKFVIKNIDTFEISEKTSMAIRFISPLFPNMHLTYWIEEEKTSLHNDDGSCVLSTFYEKASKKVYNLLKNKYNL